jgi:hypothetical protein
MRCGNFRRPDRSGTKGAHRDSLCPLWAHVFGRLDRLYYTGAEGKDERRFLQRRKLAMASQRTLTVLTLAVAVAILLFSGAALAARDNDYRAGYVIGYTEQPEVSGKDPTMTYGRYTAEKREALQKSGPVPNDFSYGLKDGFRDAIRKKRARFTLEDVNQETLPRHLRPGAK